MEKRLAIVLSGIGNRALPKNPESSNWSGWVELLKSSDNFQLVAAHDVSEDSIGRIIERGYLSSVKTYRDIDLMLSEVDCDAILISSPAEYHAITIRKALEKNIHVLVEKPFVDKLSDAKKLIDMIKKKKKVVTVVQNWRCKDVGRILYESIQNGLTGKIGHIFFRYIRDRENPNYPTYIFEEDYPLLYAMGIHHLDLFRYILKDEFHEVSGHSFKPPWSLYKSDTGLNLFLKTKSGVSVVYTGTISSKNRIMHQESLVIEGEKGTLFNESEWLEPPLYFCPYGRNEKIDLTDKIKKKSLLDQYNISDQNILQNFYYSIIGEEKPVCTARDALHSIALLEASKLACETGRLISVDKLLE